MIGIARSGMGMLTMRMGELGMGYSTAPSMGAKGIDMRYKNLGGDGDEANETGLGVCWV